MGDIAHDVIEAALGGAEIEDAWTKAVKVRATRDIPSPSALPNARRVRLRIQKRLPELLRLFDELGSNVDLLTEHELETADGSLCGRPDLVANGSETVIVDYKSGLVKDDTEVRQSYGRQLLLYGALVRECLGLTAKRLLLFSLRQGIVNVSGGVTAMEEAATRARQMRDDYNDRAPGPQPGYPSSTVCRFCRYVPVCEPFWGAVDESWQQDVGFVVRGRLRDPPEHSAWGLSAVTVKADDGPFDGQVVKISGIAGDLITNASAGDRIAVTDLRLLADDPLILGCSVEQSNQRVAVS